MDAEQNKRNGQIKEVARYLHELEVCESQIGMHLDFYQYAYLEGFSSDFAELENLLADLRTKVINKRVEVQARFDKLLPYDHTLDVSEIPF